MEKIAAIVMENQFIAIAAGFFIVLSIYFLFKSLFKIALLGIIIAVLAGGYYYFQYPGGKPSSVGDAITRFKTDSIKAVEKGRDAARKGKELIAEGQDAYRKGKKVVGEGKDAVDKGAEKGKDFIEKARDVLKVISMFFEKRDEKDNSPKPGR